MKLKILALVAVCWVACMSVSAIVVDSAAGGVAIGTEKRVDEKGRTYGYEYWVRNDNDHGIWLSVELVESHNIKETLLKREVYVAPNSTLYLGTVEQADPTVAFSWRYTWEARPTYREELQRH